MIPAPQPPKFTDNGARKALWISDNAHKYFSTIAKAQNRTHASIVDEAVISLSSRPAPTPQKSVTLTAIEIALRKDDCPSKSVQWAIEKLNQYQENQEAHDTTIRNAALDELENLQEWREQQMQEIPFDFVVFVNRENKHISHLLKSLRTEAQL